MDQGAIRGGAASPEELVYVNNLGDEGPQRVHAAYGENYPRLAGLKRTYDPDNLFRANQNIDPSTDIAGEADDSRWRKKDIR
jgi:hypothetical protein